jgi:hypothetical protein
MCSIRWWDDSDEGTGKNADRSHLGLAWNTILACIRLDRDRQRNPAVWAIGVHSLNYNWTFHQCKWNLSHMQVTDSSFQPHYPVISVTDTFSQFTRKSLFSSWIIFFRWGLVLMWPQSKQIFKYRKLTRNSIPWRKNDIFCSPRVRGGLWTFCFMQIWLIPGDKIYETQILKAIQKLYSKVFLPNVSGIALTLYTCILELLVSNLDWDTKYPELTSWFASFFIVWAG